MHEFLFFRFSANLSVHTHTPYLKYFPLVVLYAAGYSSCSSFWGCHGSPGAWDYEIYSLVLSQRLLGHTLLRFALLGAREQARPHASEMVLNLPEKASSVMAACMRALPIASHTP